MSRTMLVLLGVAVLISLGEWLSTLAASHVEMRLIPAHSRRRVQWLQSNAGHVQVGCAVVVAALLAAQAFVLLTR